MKPVVLLILLLCIPAFASAELSPMADRDLPAYFNVFIRDNVASPSPDNPVMKHIQSLTGVTMNYQFLTGNLDRTIEVMIASGAYPDAIFASPQAFINAGVFIPLEDLIQTHCPNLYAYYQPWWDKMKAPDGHIYVLDIFGIEKHRDYVLRNEGAGFWLQKRVLAYNGYVIPRTLDEYFCLIENYLSAFPETDGQPNVGFAVLCDGWLDFCLRNPPLHLMGAGNEGDVYVDPTTYEPMMYQTSEAARIYYRKLNEEYHKGVLALIQ